MYCPKCGSFNEDQAAFCTECGASFASQSAAPVQQGQQRMSDAQIQEAKSAMIQGILSIGFAAVPVLPIILGAKAKNRGKAMLAQADATGAPRSAMAGAAKTTGLIGMIFGIIMIVYWAFFILAMALDL